MQNNTFESLSISKEILDSINKKGWKVTTDIQKETIPFALMVNLIELAFKKVDPSL